MDFSVLECILDEQPRRGLAHSSRAADLRWDFEDSLERYFVLLSDRLEYFEAPAQRQIDEHIVGKVNLDLDFSGLARHYRSGTPCKVCWRM